MTKSHIPAKNALTRDVLDGQKENESKMCLKSERPIGSNDTNQRKRKTKGKLGNPEETHIEQDVVVEAHNERETPEEAQMNK